MHDKSIGNFYTIVPRATLPRRATQEVRVFVGTNSKILSDIKVGNNPIIGREQLLPKTSKQT